MKADILSGEGGPASFGCTSATFTCFSFTQQLPNARPTLKGGWEGGSPIFSPPTCLLRTESPRLGSEAWKGLERKKGSQ